MDKKLIKGFTSLYTVEGTPNGYIRGALWATTILGVGLCVNGVIKKIKSLNEQKLIQQRVNQLNADLSNVSKAETPTFDDSVYQADAETMFAILNKWDVGIIAPCWIMSMWGKQLQDILSRYKNDIDILKLEAAYGVRSVTRPFIFGGDINNADFITTLRQKLADNEISCINKDLQAKGIIKVQF
jgi:hypothetical protein